MGPDVLFDSSEAPGVLVTVAGGSALGTSAVAAKVGVSSPDPPQAIVNNANRVTKPIRLRMLLLTPRRSKTETSLA